MNAAPFPPRRGDAKDAFDRFVRHCSRYLNLAPRRYPRGVFKFRSLEEAQAARRDHIEARRDRDGAPEGAPYRA